MATQPDENWANIEPGIQDLIERFQQDDVDLFLDQYVNSSPGEAPLYTPLYTLQPSTADGLDDSTSLVSGPQEPGLTRGGSTLPFSHHAQTCPTLGRPFGEPQLSHHGTYPAQPQPRESCDDWSAPQVDLQFIGQGPGIHDQCLVSFPPVHLQDEDLPTYLTPTTFGYNIPLPGVAAANVSATSLPFVGRSSSGGLSRARMSSLGIPSAIGSPMSVAGASSQPMARGRSNPLPEQKRAKAAVMRNTKACMRCRIRHVEVSFPRLLADQEAVLLMLQCRSATRVSLACSVRRTSRGTRTCAIERDWLRCFRERTDRVRNTGDPFPF